jgi:hypothetical protein
MMSRLPDAPICERGNDLISFLYGEIDEDAARGFERDFERHLLNCAGCQSDLSAFKQIRSSVVAWRQESLGGITANSISASRAVNRGSDLRKPSAIGAIREFFNLSPLWLKGSIAFASVLFCVLSVIALGRLFEKPGPVVVADEKLYTEKELRAKIDDAMKSQSQDRASKGNTILPAPVKPRLVNNQQQAKLQRTGTSRSKESLAANPKVRRGPLTRSEREQLAADLRLIVPQDDADLDLLSDGNN